MSDRINRRLLQLLGYDSGSPSLNALRGSRPAIDETRFQEEIRSTEWFNEYVKQYGEEPDLNTPDYDYRSAWAAGVRPERYEYDNGRYHWPSSLPDGTMLKGDEHPTLWKELFMREFGINPDQIRLTSRPDFSMLDRPLKSAPRR
jgi:hypothetical protein